MKETLPKRRTVERSKVEDIVKQSYRSIMKDAKFGLGGIKSEPPSPSIIL